jgi:hypothetical protein
MMVEAIWIVTWIGTILGATKKPAQSVSIMMLRFPFEVCCTPRGYKYILRRLFLLDSDSKMPFPKTFNAFVP